VRDAGCGLGEVTELAAPQHPLACGLLAIHPED
jgi:hypothetical protein